VTESRPIDEKLMAILRCPACTGTFEEPAGDELVCSSCGLAYPVRDGVPILLVDEARHPGA
jgi:uncharacterized protein